ncbi:uncharacterized protein TRIVIDRAFT_113898, partial [Trichoderma virens Gv29-8]
GHERRDISHSQFGDNTVIHQGNVHLHLPRRPARAEVVRVIPYPPNEDLVRRRGLIDRLDKLLPQTPGFHSAALWGLGGSGKTQIALDYAYRRCDDSNCCVFWVHADSEATFITDYKAIGQKLGVDESLDGSDLLNAVRSSIEAQPRWVIILDNADNLKLFGVDREEGMNERLSRYIPGGPQGTILWTSRDAHITGTLVGSSRGIEVSSMTRGEATALLAATRGDRLAVEDVGIDQLLEELQRLPLAVSQAGAYIRRTSMTIKEYLDLLTQGSSRWDLLKMNSFDRHRRPEVSNSVLETWKISTQKIREESELSYRILNVIAYLDSQDIPHELIVAASRYSVDEEGRAEQVHKLEVQQAVMRLVEFSFLDMRRGEGGLRIYEMHKLLQEAVRYGLWVQGPMEMAFSEITTRHNQPQNAEAYYSSIALQMVDDIFPVSKQDSWARCEQFIAHAIRVGEWAEISGKAVETSALLGRVSDFLYDRGRWREKEPVDRRALDLRREALGEEHPDTVISLSNLAITYHEQGRYDEAERLKNQVLDLRREILGEKHPNTIRSMVNIAATYYVQGRYDEAERLTKQGLDLQREILGEKHPSTIWSIAKLAAIYFAQDRLDEAMRLSKQGFDLQREILGEKHPDTIFSMTYLAAVYYTQGRYDKAERLQKQALDFQREVLGEKHPHTMRSMANLSAIYYRQGRYNEDERLKKQALDLKREVLGEKHPDTI